MSLSFEIKTVQENLHRVSVVDDEEQVLSVLLDWTEVNKLKNALDRYIEET